MLLIRVLKTDGKSHMDMAVDDTGHDEFPAQISDLSFIPRKTGFIPHIGEFRFKSGGNTEFVLYCH